MNRELKWKVRIGIESKRTSEAKSSAFLESDVFLKSLPCAKHSECLD